MAKRKIPNIGANDMRRYAAVGAQARIVELGAEIERILAAFPPLREGKPPFPTAAQRAGRPKAQRVKRTMSAEARKRIGDAQRARWAKQKAGGKKR